MKPLDLKAAKAGEPVITRDGRDVRIICFNMKQNPLLIVALVDHGDYEKVQLYTSDGKFNYDNIYSDYDLFMKPVTKTYHYCIYKLNNSGSCAYTASPLFNSEEEVRDFISSETTALEYRTISIEE